MAIPESELINCEIILREMQLTQDVKMTRKSLVRWLALSMGLISPKESRTLMIDLLESLFYFQFAEKKDPEVAEIMEYLQTNSTEEVAGEKAVRYHLLQLSNLGLLERDKGKYRFAVSPLSEKGDFSATVDYVYKRRCDVALAKMKEAAKELSYSFSKKN